MAALAGAAGLANEVVWTRALVPVLGNTTQAAAAVLAAVAGAYGIGAHFAARSRASGRAIAVLGSLLAAGFALAVPRLASSGSLLASVPGPWIAASVILSVPALAMGAVFAALFRGLGEEPTTARAGFLACANALGAGAGALAAGVWGVVGVGLRGTGGIAALGHVLAAALAAAALAPGAPRREERTTDPGARGGGGVFAALLAVGFVSLGVQVVATRTAAVLLEGFTPVYASVVGVSLVGLALGAVSGGALARQVPPSRAFGAALLASALGVALCTISPILLADSPRWLSPRSPAQWAAGLLGVAALLTLPAAIPLGACFPLGFAALRGPAGKRAGITAAALSLGSAAGPPVVGLALVPGLGVPRTGVALGIALFALAVGGWRRRRGGDVILVALGAAAMIPAARTESVVRFAPRIARAPEITVLDARDDVAFSVGVIEDGREGERTLVTDAFRAAGTGEEYRYMRALAHLPARLHGAIRRACVIGLGIGSTAGALALHPSLERLEVVEISPAVIEFSPFFLARNAPLFPGGSLHPSARFASGDGRRHLLRSSGGYDLVTLEPLLPTMPVAVHFYTREFLDLARARLATGGLLCHWVPLHALSPEEVDRVVATFVRAFPASALYVVGSSLILVGGDRIPEAPAVAISDALAADLAGTDLDSPDGVARLLLCGGESLLERLRDVPDLTDDLPAIESVSFRSPREAYAFLHSNLSRALEWFEGDERDPARRFARRFLEARREDAAEDLAERGYDVQRGPVDPATLYGALLGAAPGSSLLRSQRDAYLFRVGLREGFLALRAGLLEEATESFAEAVEARPYRFEPRFFLAAALSGAQRRRGALLQAARAFALVPGWRSLREASAEREPARTLLEGAAGLVEEAESLARRRDLAVRDRDSVLGALRGSDDGARIAAFRALASEPAWREPLTEGDRRRVVGWSRVYGVGADPLW